MPSSQKPHSITTASSQYHHIIVTEAYNRGSSYQVEDVLAVGELAARREHGRVARVPDLAVAALRRVADPVVDDLRQHELERLRDVGHMIRR